MNFKEWLLKEGKAIVFPPEVQQKLYSIAEKILDIFTKTRQDKVEINKVKAYPVDTLEFYDPYTKKNRKYEIIFHNTHDNDTKTNYGGYHMGYDRTPHIVISGKMIKRNLYSGLDDNQKWLSQLPKGGSIKSLYSYIYNNKEKILLDIYHVLSHEVAHGHDITLSKGMRSDDLGTDEFQRFAQESDYYEKNKGIFSKFLDSLGRKNPTDRFMNFYSIKDKPQLPSRLRLPEYGEKDQALKLTKYNSEESEVVANLAGWSNNLINYARMTIKNDDASTIVLKRDQIFKDLIDYLRNGKSLRQDFNPFLNVGVFWQLKSALDYTKKNKPTFYRRIMEALSNAALQAYDIVTKHIKDNNLISKVNQDHQNWFSPNYRTPRTDWKSTKTLSS